MPNIFLSPSVQEYNEYLNGGSEEYYMNLIADAMEPYLNINDINLQEIIPKSRFHKLLKILIAEIMICICQFIQMLHRKT